MEFYPLAFAPTLNAEDYFTVKCEYSIKGLVICGDIARITCIEMGLLSGSIFSAYLVMVPAFKKGQNAMLGAEGMYFNTKLAKIRNKCEHCICLFKAPFLHLKGHQPVIQSKRDLDAILRTTMCACICTTF